MFQMFLNQFNPLTYYNINVASQLSVDQSIKIIISKPVAAGDSHDFVGTDYADHFVFDGNHAYRADALSFSGGAGNDFFAIGSGDHQYVGSILIYGGMGDDNITVGQIQGPNAALNEIDGGDGNDSILIRATNGAVSFFGNGRFAISGGGGDDRVKIEGQAFNLMGDNINVVDGGTGFDTFVWSAKYDLNRGSNQTGVDQSYSPYPLEIGLANFEHLVIDVTERGQPITLTQSDVIKITSGSDFARVLLGLGQTGSGKALVVSTGANVPLLDLAGWNLLGTTNWAAFQGYSVFESGDALLIVEPALISPIIPAAVEIYIDTVAGGRILLASVFDQFDSTAWVTITTSDDQPTSFATWDQASASIRIAANAPLSAAPTVNINFQANDGTVTVRRLTLSPLSLTFGFKALPSAATTIAIGDINGDGLSDFFGAYRQPDGSFIAADASAAGLSAHFTSGRSRRANFLADLDNDGDLDALALGYGPSSEALNRAYLYENDGLGVFTQPAGFVAMDICGFSETPVFADFNNDGLTDIYIPFYFRADADGSTPAGSRMLINQGGMNFEDQTYDWEILNRTGNLSLGGFGATHDANNMPEAAQAFDFNKDGLIDLFVNSHLFMNTGNSFIDVNDALGLPIIFEEGAKFFDFDNDGYLDFLTVSPTTGAYLFKFNSLTMRFDNMSEVLPFVGNYNSTVGIATGDLNGDGWDDIIIGAGANESPHFWINQSGERFIEYSSASLLSWAATYSPIINDVDGDGSQDIVSAFGLGIRTGLGSPAASTVQITLLGANGERNQHGRIVQLEPTASGDDRILTRIVDGGSHYISQGDYAATFTDGATGSYLAHAYLIDYPSGSPVRLTFTATSNRQYAVYAASGTQSSRVIDLLTNTDISHSRTYSLTLADDILTVSAAGDVKIDGLSGDDVITANNGNDVINGGTGADRMLGGAGNDFYIVDNTNDVLLELADEGTESIDASVSFALADNIENLRLTGLANINGSGNALANIVKGNAGNNRLDGGLGADHLIGYGGNDVYVIDHISDLIVEEANDGTDTVEASISVVLLHNFENLRLMSSANINGSGNALANIIEGGAGNNRLDGGLGADYLIGYGGNDIYVVDHVADRISEAANGGTDTVEASVSFALSNNTENLRLMSSANIDGSGNGHANIIEGGAGDNRLDGGLGADYLIGYGGNDVYVVNHVADRISEAVNGGIDTVEASISFALSSNIENLRLMSLANVNGSGNALANIIEGGGGNNRLDGGLGADYLIGYGGNDVYIIDHIGDRISEAENEGTDTVEASISFALADNTENLRLMSSANINASGNALANIVEGSSGSNRIDGGLGADYLIGYGGNDVYVVDHVADRISEAVNGGIDTVEASVSFALSNNIENLRLMSSANIDGSGNGHANIIEGGAGNNRLDGGLGADYLIGYGGNDVYIVDHIGDRIAEAADEGIDTVEASVSFAMSIELEQLILTGTANLNGFGNARANVLTGNSGNNCLDGGAGDDTLVQQSDGSRDVISGSSGTDTFELLGDMAVLERFTIYDRASAITAGFGAGLNGASMIVIVREVHAANGTDWINPNVISELNSIEEIVVKTSGNGPPALPFVSAGFDVAASGDTIRVIGNFDGTGLAYNTITVDGGIQNEVVDITGLRSEHRVVFNGGGGDDSLLGQVRSQDIVNGGKVNAVPSARPRRFSPQPVSVSLAEANTCYPVSVDPLNRLLAIISQDVASFGGKGSANDMTRSARCSSQLPEWFGFIA